MTIEKGRWHPMVEAMLGREEPGAWPIGSRVRKLVTEERDGHQPGAMATVCGSCGPVDAPGMPPATMVYILEWDDRPGLPVLVAAAGAKGPRLELISKGIRPS